MSNGLIFKQNDCGFNIDDISVDRGNNAAYDRFVAYREELIRLQERQENTEQ